MRLAYINFTVKDLTKNQEVQQILKKQKRKRGGDKWQN